MSERKSERCVFITPGVHGWLGSKSNSALPTTLQAFYAIALLSALSVKYAMPIMSNHVDDIVMTLTGTCVQIMLLFGALMWGVLAFGVLKRPASRPVNGVHRRPRPSGGDDEQPLRGLSPMGREIPQEC